MTRALVDIESITENEKAVGEYLLRHLSAFAARTGGMVEAMTVTPERFNVYAEWGTPTVVLSTHMDTVPPFFRSSEDEENIYGRGTCDAKGIIAAMIAAAEKLIESGTRNFGLLFVVGEERNSAGAEVASRSPRGARYLINPGSVGQPRDNDRRAAYALYDDERMIVEFRRVPYDFRLAQMRIMRAGLPDQLAMRLSFGR